MRDTSTKFKKTRINTIIYIYLYILLYIFEELGMNVLMFICVFKYILSRILLSLDLTKTNNRAAHIEGLENRARLADPFLGIASSPR